MCAPGVMAYVKDHVNRRLTRRDLFKVAAGGAAAITLGRASAQGAAQGLSLANLADLTHTLTPEFPLFPGYDPLRITNLVTVEQDGFYANRWDLVEHSGTHMDAPAHFVTGAPSVDRLELANLIVPLAVVDISAKAEGNPDAVLEVADLEAWEREHGELPPNAAVMMYSAWETRLGDPAQFVNADETGTLHFPGFSPAAAEFLVGERAIAGVGVDTLSLDPGNATSFDTHLTVLGAGKWGLECVANLASLPPVGAHLIVGAPKVGGASGGPVRLMAAWG